MGTYDMISLEINGKTETVQVKTWGCNFRDYVIWDSVPPVSGNRDYCIVVPEGYLIIIKDLYIKEVHDINEIQAIPYLQFTEHYHVHDKW